jgi:hypothetical protein
MTDNDPITLAEACEIVFKNKVTPATLRAEHRRGRLDIFRVGKRDFVYLRDVRAMVERCRVEDPRRDFISIRNANNGLSETERASSALDFALNELEKRKKSLGITSRVGTHRKNKKG